MKQKKNLITTLMLVLLVLKHALIRIIQHVAEILFANVLLKYRMNLTIRIMIIYRKKKRLNLQMMK